MICPPKTAFKAFTLIPSNKENNSDTLKISESPNENNITANNSPKNETVIIKKPCVMRYFHVFAPPKPTGKYSGINFNIIKLYNVLKSEKKKREKGRAQRKYKPDDIRKKIKSNFLKSIKNEINKKLLKAGSKKVFYQVNQAFVSNVTKEYNKNYLDKTWEEILLERYTGDKKEDDKNYLRNKEVLEYLHKNPKIEKESNFNAIKRLRLRNIYEEYLYSSQCVKLVQKIKGKEKEDYFRKYIILLVEFIQHFSG